MWHAPTVGENRLNAFLAAYTQAAEDWLERNPNTLAPWMLDAPNMVTHLDYIANLLRNGRFDPKQWFFREVCLRLGIKNNNKAIIAWIRGS